MTSLEGLLMKFSTIGEGMRAADDIFDKLDTNQDGFIDQDEWKVGRQLLHLPEEPGRLEQEFSASLMHGDNVCHRDEFLVLLAIMHVLEETNLPEQLDHTYLILEAAFNCFDTAQSGILSRSEVEAQLSCDHENAHARVSNQRPSTGKLLTTRFSELDSLHCDAITFPQFVLCLRNWVFDDLEALSPE